MVPFSYFQSLLSSRGMNHFSSPVEEWTLGALDFSEAWRLQLCTFALSCLLAFLILIPALIFYLYSVPLRLCGQSAFVSLHVHSWLRIVGSMVSIIDRQAGRGCQKWAKLQNKPNCNNQINHTNKITCTIFRFKKNKKQTQFSWLKHLMHDT
jgi:hypothetical protein